MKGKRTRNGLHLEAAEKRERKSTNAALSGLHQFRFAPFLAPSLSSFLSLCHAKQYENRNDRNSCDRRRERMDASTCEEIKCKTFLPRNNGLAPLPRSFLSFFRVPHIGSSSVVGQSGNKKKGAGEARWTRPHVRNVTEGSDERRGACGSVPWSPRWHALWGEKWLPPSPSFLSVLPICTRPERTCPAETAATCPTTRVILATTASRIIDN